MSLSEAVICDTRRNKMEIYSFWNEKFVIREIQINNLQNENLCEGLHRPERWIGQFTSSVDCIRNLANNRNYYYRSDPFFRSSSKLCAVTMENGMRLLSGFPAAGE